MVGILLEYDCFIIAARHQAAAVEEEPDFVDESDEDAPRETVKVDLEDKMGAKVQSQLIFIIVI